MLINRRLKLVNLPRRISNAKGLHKVCSFNSKTNATFKRDSTYIHTYILLRRFITRVDLDPQFHIRTNSSRNSGRRLVVKHQRKRSNSHLLKRSWPVFIRIPQTSCSPIYKQKFLFNN